MGGLRHLKYINSHLGDLTGRTIVITGANSGIGFYASRYLAYKGATIVMACRNQKKAELAKSLILEEIKNANIDILSLDQASFSSIEKFAEELKGKYAKIDSFVFNAGIFHPKKDAVTSDGYPLTIGTNYLGTFYLMELLMPYFKQMDKVNVVCVGTIANHNARQFSAEKYFFNHDLTLYDQYALSKRLMMSNHYFYMNQPSMNGIFSMTHPGIASTNIVSGSSNSFPRWFSRLARAFMSFFMHNPEKAALGIVLCASNEGNHGQYLAPRGLWEIRGYPVVKKMPKRLMSEADAIHRETLAYFHSIGKLQ
ncbi:MAG: SDR family NAD(P)-dependent oxidoreductase [Bacilli bacterium]|jgi:NAD(P)-dependent dehydrogenase (short-subunit alcohol dehydrogenase family)